MLDLIDKKYKTSTQFPSTQSQSLIETIVAIGVIVTAIVAILSVGLSHTILGGQSAENIQATNLAREGIEVINAIVSSNRLDPDQSWPFGITTNDIYVVDYNDTSLGTVATFSGAETIDNCTNCYLCKQTNDLYTHTDCVQQEVFRRMITVSDGDDLGGNCSNNCEKKIVSTVYWIERGREHTLSVEYHLTDWR